jgi:hypothetical protein
MPGLAAMLVAEKFAKMIAFLRSPVGQRVRTNNHVERMNRVLRLHTQTGSDSRQSHVLFHPFHEPKPRHKIVPSRGKPTADPGATSSLDLSDLEHPDTGHGCRAAARK